MFKNFLFFIIIIFWERKKKKFLFFLFSKIVFFQICNILGTAKIKIFIFQVPSLLLIKFLCVKLYGYYIKLHVYIIVRLNIFDYAKAYANVDMFFLWNVYMLVLLKNSADTAPR